MKLILTATSYPPATGGAQLYLHKLAINLIEKHHIQVISFWDRNRTDWLSGTTIKAPDHETDFHIDGIPVHTLGFTSAEKTQILFDLFLYYLNSDRSVKHLASLLEPKISKWSLNASLIHNVRIGREPISYASLSAARKQNIPFVLTPVHHPRWKGWLYRTYDNLYRQADALIALTNAEKELLISEKGVKEEHVYVTGMGPILSKSADPEQYRQKNSLEGPVILFLGQHYPYKGFYQLLQAAQYIWMKIPEAQFVFIGPAVGNSEQVFAKFTDYRIRRLGTVSLQEKTDALAACDLLCVPSTQESFGGVYTEAWSFAKPVIGCDIPAVREVIDDGINGYLTMQNPHEIAERCIDLLLNPERARSFGENGSQKVLARYTWSHLAELTEQVYVDVTGASK